MENAPPPRLAEATTRRRSGAAATALAARVPTVGQQPQKDSTGELAGDEKICAVFNSILTGLKASVVVLLTVIYGVPFVQKISAGITFASYQNRLLLTTVSVHYLPP